MEILYFALIAYINYFIFGSGKILLCGLFGYSGSVAPDMNSIKILGMYNTTRGTDSCGIFIDGEVYKGVGKESDFADYIIENELPKPKKNYSIIGHTRNSSVGSNTKANAHPFSFTIKGKRSSVAVHNGTLKNWRELAKNYGYDSKEYDVDSELLSHILVNGNNEILKEYEGAATVLIHHLKKPNGLWIWKGASEEYNKVTGDRPLFGLQKKKGIYISSIEESLKVIREKGDEIINFPTNTIIELENGKITKESKVDRELKKYTAIKKTNSKVKNLPSSTSSGGDVSYKNYNGDVISDKERKSFGGKVYWFKGRYWRNGHLINGDYELLENGEQARSNDPAELYCFHKGILLNISNRKAAENIRNEIDKAFTDISLQNHYMRRRDIAIFSRHPFDFLKEEVKGLPTRSGWLLLGSNKACYTGSFKTLFARKLEIDAVSGDIEGIKKIKEDVDWDTLTEEEWKKMVDKNLEDIIDNNSCFEHLTIDEIQNLPDPFWNELNWNEVEWQQMSKDVETFVRNKKYQYEVDTIDNLENKDSEFWESLNWESLNLDKEPSTVCNYYFDMAKKYKKEEQEEDLTDQKVSDSFLLDEYENLIANHEILIENIIAGNYEETNLSEKIIRKLESSLEFLKDEEIIWEN